MSLANTGIQWTPFISSTFSEELLRYMIKDPKICNIFNFASFLQDKKKSLKGYNDKKRAKIIFMGEAHCICKSLET